MSLIGKVRANAESILAFFREEDNISRATRRFCESEGIEYTDSLRKRVSEYINSLENKNDDVKSESKSLLIPKEAINRTLTKSKYYLVTWEQNESVLHENLWNNILAYKEFLNAELSVILGRYKNPTSVHTDVKHENWNIKTKKYWDSNRHNVHKFCTLLSDVKIQPTASNPLSGLESITGQTTTVIGHPKQHLKTIPTLEGQPNKILLSTGAITLPNYTDSKSGKKGEFNHTLGFVIIEIKDDNKFFIRQVEADKNGNFIDLYHKVENGIVSKNEDTSCIVWGDTHVGKIEEKILNPTYNLIERLNINTEVHHDIIDGDSVNSHILKDPISRFKRMQEGKDGVIDDLNEIVNFLSKRDTKKVVVQANHNDRFDRWLLNQDWKQDLKNAVPYLELVLAKLKGEAEKGVVPYWLNKNFKDNEVKCLAYDDSYIIDGFELAHHGHIGSNGVKGTLEQFRRLSTRMIIGHYHSPQKIDGVIAVGTSSKLRAGYNKGASSWLNAHALIYKNKTAQLIIFVDGEFTTFK